MITAIGSLNKNIRKNIIEAQRNEISEYYIYKKLAQKLKVRKNKQILLEIAEDEYKHYNFWREITGVEVSPSKWMIFKYYIISRILGTTFGAKLMEINERNAQKIYADLAESVRETEEIRKDEEKHEKYLLNIIKEDHLDYLSSIILGMNDALVELTGALAGFTFLLRDNHLIAAAGLVTGIAAAFSMAASDYLSQKHEKNTKRPLKSAFYTGMTYIVTVGILISPYMVFHNPYLALLITFVDGLLIILSFNIYLSVVNDTNFKRQFSEMALITFGVAIFSYFMGIMVKSYLGLDV